MWGTVCRGPGAGVDIRGERGQGVHVVAPGLVTVVRDALQELRLGEEVAQTVEDGFAAVDLDAERLVPAVADEDVRAGLDRTVGELLTNRGGRSPRGPSEMLKWWATMTRSAIAAADRIDRRLPSRSPWWHSVWIPNSSPSRKTISPAAD